MESHKTHCRYLCTKLIVLQKCSADLLVTFLPPQAAVGGGLLPVWRPREKQRFLSLRAWKCDGLEYLHFGEWNSAVWILLKLRNFSSWDTGCVCVCSLSRQSGCWVPGARLSPRWAFPSQADAHSACGMWGIETARSLLTKKPFSQYSVLVFFLSFVAWILDMLFLFFTLC